MANLSMSEVRQINDQRGFRFFSRENMKFFNTKIHSRNLIDNKYFITSDKGLDLPRRYTVREFDHKSGDILTVGEFQQFRSIQEAKEFLKD